jgi:HK97 family phage major capsid protein
MRTIAAIRAQRAEILASAEAIIDAADEAGRALTAAEQQEFDECVAHAERINAELKARPRISEHNQPSNALPEDDINAQRARRIVTFNPGARLQAFADNRTGHESAYRAGMWIRAALLGEAKALNWCKQNGVDVDIRAAHSAGDNAKGGVLVPEELSRTIIRLVDEHGVFRRNSRVVPMSSDTLNIPRRTGGLTASYVGENVEGEESDTAWDNVSLVAKKLMILTRMSSEIAEDAIIAMADILAMEAALAFALKEDTVGFTGTGSAADGGIVGVLVKALDAAHTKAKVEAAATHDTFAEIDSDDIIKLMSMVPKYAKKGSRFYCSSTVLELVFNAIKVSAGGNSLENLANQVQPFFLGYPIEVSEVFADDPAATYNGTVICAFGNLTQASTFGSRRDMRFATTDSRYWEQDQIGVKATMRHDINVHDLGSTTVKSPFAVLVGKT